MSKRASLRKVEGCDKDCPTRDESQNRRRNLIVSKAALVSQVKESNRNRSWEQKPRKSCNVGITDHSSEPKPLMYAPA
ncbi:hypothetical protein OGM63_24810 [Plectonema radiosum NIES-515]|uniref:Uncharacterized protein n=1 Tax=Plectonema radiosum NIES-515 TaxID=2986073 RepID=A0ABT3B648_9CYAN|nr:hypothetical protein [Plectonema radiosum]MCV3216685.1 hypothetical protein [Plectonema radiosum NIES-515]